MAAIYSNGGNRWNILGFNFTKRDALSSLYKISMAQKSKEGPKSTGICNYVLTDIPQHFFISSGTFCLK
jgi:hypothetical protein